MEMCSMWMSLDSRADIYKNIKSVASNDKDKTSQKS